MHNQRFAEFCAVRIFWGVCPLFCVCPLFIAAGRLGVCTPKKSKNTALSVFFGGEECGISIFAAFRAVMIFWGDCPLFAICPLFSAHRPAPQKSGQNLGRVLPVSEMR